MDSIDINLDGLRLGVDYFYQKGMKGDYFQPNDQDEFEILEVVHEGSLILSYLNEQTIERIKTEIIKKIK